MHGWLPDRVIDVGFADGPLRPKLVERKDILHSLAPAERQFVALSHCWGANAIITTNVASFEDRKRGIPMERLSQTFRDAVVATRKLGRRFLWIDSLCIIQDSKEDWQKQSVQMCTVYQRAVFTIMAAHASGGHEGCFVRRDGRAQLPLRLRFGTSDGDDITVDACFLSLSRMSAELSFALPLYSRAWVLQEQAISRARLIYFGEQVYWECQSARGSERCPNGGSEISGLTNFSRAIATRDDPFVVWRNEDAKMFVEGMHSQWCVLVENYMERGITHTTDRLIAVDGVAQAIRERTSNQYLAGLWRDQLVMGLMWHIPLHAGDSERWRAVTRKASTYLSSRHEKPLAPSWSWASVTYPVEWPWSHSIKQIFMDFQASCKILDAKVTGTPFEQTGTVVIQGNTRRLWIDSCYPDLHFAGSEKNPKIKQFGIINRDYHSEWAWAKCRATTKKPSSTKDFGYFAIEFHPDEILDRTQEVTFLALGEIPANPSPKTNFCFSRPSTLTLALQPTGQPNEYRRVGFAEWRNCSWYGYFCIGDNYNSEHWKSLKLAYLIGGWTMFVREFLEVCIVLVFGTLMQQPIVQLERDGLVWFRELAKGNWIWGHHEHETGPKGRSKFRKGWEPTTKCLTIN